jgi:phenylalanyl-tRNA synthetase alpha subunit
MVLTTAQHLQLLHMCGCLLAGSHYAPCPVKYRFALSDSKKPLLAKFLKSFFTMSLTTSLSLLCLWSLSGIKQLRFKPAYNPYTEPSMEIFGYHPELGKWTEIGRTF